MSAMPAPTPRSRSRWRTPRHCGRRSRPSTGPATGSSSKGAALVVEAMTVEGIGAMEEIAEPEPPVVPRNSRRHWSRVLRTPIFTTRAPHQPAERFAAAVFSREALQPGDRVTGPALVVVRPPPSWSSPAGALAVTPRDHLILDRIEPLARQVAVGTQCRPDAARDLQQPVHDHRRADGRGAAEHRLLGQHQGAAGLLLRACSRPTASWSPTPRTCRSIWARWARSVGTIIELNQGACARATSGR